MAKYRMTPKRRAALKRAQQASARKRRRARNKRIAIGVGVTSAAILGVGTAAYFRSKRPKPSAFNPVHQLALPPGRSVTKVKSRKPRPIPERKGSWKVPSNGLPYYVRRPRGAYDAKRRAGLVSGYEKKVRSKYDGMSPRSDRRRKKARG